MAVVINTNSAATVASNNLAASNQILQRSLNRLSSGTKIVTPADDAGGLAVSMKLAAAARRQSAALTNISNGTSFLQTQDGALKVAGTILNRIGELKTLAQDPTKSASDLDNYNAEYTSLQEQLSSLADQDLNGVSLFDAATLDVPTSEDGAASVAIGGVDLLGTAGGTWTDISGISVGSTFTESTPGMITTGPGYMIFTSDGTLTSVENNISGPFSMSFDYSNTGSTDTMSVNVGGTALDLTALVGGTGFFAIEIEYDGTQTTVSVDGGSATVIPDISSGSGGAVTFSHGGNDGAPYSSIYHFELNNTAGGTAVRSVAEAADLAALSLSTVTDAIGEIATHRATNGAQQSRLGYAAELLTTNKANLEAAASRIVDVDVAEESTRLARFNILVQSGTSMLAQANQSSQLALRLLG